MGLPITVAVLLSAWGSVGTVWLLILRRWLTKFVPDDGVSPIGDIVTFVDYLVGVTGIVLSVVCYLYHP